MSIGIYPGSFDPPTYGHLNIIRRTAAVFDTVVVCVMEAGPKAKPLFTAEERMELLRQICRDMENVRVVFCDGLLARYVSSYEKPVIIRGLRDVADFEAEFHMTSVNKLLNPELETMFMAADNGYAFLSSGAVREIGRHGEKLSEFVPEAVEKAVREKFRPADAT